MQSSVPSHPKAASWSLAMRQFLLQSVILLLIAVIAGVYLVKVARDQNTDAVAERTKALALAVAASANVIDAAAKPEPWQTLQPFSLELQSSVEMDYIVIMSPAGIRWTHPTPSEIGKMYRGSISQAQAGEVFTETFDGTLGPSIRTIAPARNSAGAIVALVSVGLTVDRADHLVQPIVLTVIVGVALVLLLALLGTLLISRWVRRTTRGRRPEEMSESFTYYDAVVGSVNEGMVLLDAAGQVVTANPQAQVLLAGSTNELPTVLDFLRVGNEPIRDEVVVTEDRVLVVDRSPVTIEGKHFGSVVTLRDHTEQEALTNQLRSAQDFTSALRAQAHETANRLHTVISLVEMGETEEALRFAVAELQFSQVLADRLMEGVSDPVLAALLLGKSAQAAQSGIEVLVEKGSYLPTLPGHSRELVTILGNLIDNAMAALAESGSDHSRSRKVVRVSCRSQPSTTAPSDVDVVIVVSDNGPGMEAEVWPRIFVPGWTTNHGTGVAGARGLGLALVGQAVRRLGGTIAVGHGPGGHGAMFTVRFAARTAIGQFADAVRTGSTHA